MTDCAHAQRLIPLLYDEELDGPQRREIRDHVVSCTDCTRVRASLEREQELLRQAIDEEMEEIDFSGFWQGIESKLLTPQISWTDHVQLWWESWRPPLWEWRAPIWVAASMTLVLGGIFFPFHKPNPPLGHFENHENRMAFVENDQAHIESLAASDTVFVWNEPTSNATVIWVGDEIEEGMP